MGGLIRAAIHNRVAANLIMVGLIFAGFAAILNLNVRLFPEIALNAVTITVPYPGATPREVESSVIVPIEERLEGLEGVKEISSLATSNVGNVVVTLNRGEDLSEKLDEVKSEIDRITVFPDEAEEPQVTDIDTRELTIQLVVHGDVAPTELKRVANRVRDALTARDDVSQVEIVGVPEDQIDVAVSMETLRAYGVSLTQLSQSIGQGSLDLSAGEIETGDRRSLVRTIGENKTAEAFADVVVLTGENGAGVRLGDIAQVTDGFSDDPIIGRFNGDPAVVLTIYRSGEEQIFRTVADVRDYVENDAAWKLPAGVEIEIWRDESTELEGRISLLTRNAALGIFLVMITLTLFLDVRVAGWVAAGIAVAFMGAFVLMSAFGISIDQLSLFGFILAIGIVVDDAIVVGENIFAERAKGRNPVDAACVGAVRISRPVLFSVTTTIVAFTPLLLLPSTVGQFVAPAAAVVIFVLILSLVEVFFVLPRHLSHLSDQPAGKWSIRRFTDPLKDRVGGALVSFANGPLRKALRFSVTHPGFVVASALGVAFCVFGLISSGIVKQVFFPSVPGNYVYATGELPQSSPEDRTFAIAQHMERAAVEAATVIADREGVALDEVLNGTILSIGFSTAPDEADVVASGGASADAATVVARLVDASERNWPSGDFEAEWRKAIGEIAGMRALSVSSDLIGVGRSVVLQVSADDPDQARAAAAVIRQRLEATDGVFDIDDDRFQTTDEITIALKPEARAYGLTLEDLARETRAALFGAEAVRTPREREELVVRVRLPEDERDTISDLVNYRVPVGDAFVPLGAVAELNRQPAPASIARLDGREIITVSAEVNDAIVTGGEVTAMVLEQVLPQLQDDDPSVTISVGGEQQESADTGPALARNFLLALFVIYAILALASNSYAQPLVILGVIPFAYVGALAGHGLMGLNLSFLSMFGIVGLSGVIINNALLIMDFVNERRDRGMEPREAIIDAAADRFRPIVLTTMTTFLGVFPLILETSIQAQFLIPTAVSLGFGILFGSSFVIFVTPALASLLVRAENARAAVMRAVTGQPRDAASPAE